MSKLLIESTDNKFMSSLIDYLNRAEAEKDSTTVKVVDDNNSLIVANEVGDRIEISADFPDCEINLRLTENQTRLLKKQLDDILSDQSELASCKCAINNVRVELASIKAYLSSDKLRPYVQVQDVLNRLELALSATFSPGD